MFDITELKLAEEQLVRSLEAEKEASARERALNEMQHSFLQAVSHDLRTPLTSILGNALTLQREDIEIPPEEARDLMGRVATNARKLQRLVTDLLDLDRITRGVIEPNRVDVDLSRLILNVLEESASNDHPVRLADPLPAARHAGVGIRPAGGRGGADRGRGRGTRRSFGATRAHLRAVPAG